MAQKSNTDLDSSENTDPLYYKNLWNTYKDFYDDSGKRRLSDISEGAKQLADVSNPNYFDSTPEQTRNAQAANAVAMGTMSLGGKPNPAEFIDLHAKELAEKAAESAPKIGQIGEHIGGDDAEVLADLMGISPAVKAHALESRAAQAESAFKLHPTAARVEESLGANNSIKSAKESAGAFEEQLPKMESPKDPDVIPTSIFERYKNQIAGGTALAAGLGSKAVIDSQNQQGLKRLAPDYGIPFVNKKQDIKEDDGQGDTEYDQDEQTLEDLYNSPENNRPIQGNAAPAKFISQDSTPVAAKPSQDQVGDVLKSAQSQSIASDAALRDAQERSRKEELVNRLGKAAGLFGASLAKTTPQGQEGWDQNIAAAGRHVEELKARIANQKDDPGSEISKSSRKMMSQALGKEIPETMSASALEKISPILQKINDNKLKLEEHKFTSEQNRLSRENLMKIAQLENKTKREEKIERDDIKRFRTLGDKLNEDLASGRTAFGRSAGIVRAANAIDAFIHQNGITDYNKVSPIQIKELARSLDGMLTTGQTSVRSMQMLIPKSYKGDVKAFLEKLYNEPTGADQGKFVAQMLHGVGTERDIAKKHIMSTKLKILAPDLDLMEKYPEKWEQVTNIHELPEDLIEKYSSNNKEKETKSSPAPHGNTVIQNGKTFTWNPSSKKYEVIK